MVLLLLPRRHCLALVVAIVTVTLTPSLGFAPIIHYKIPPTAQLVETPSNTQFFTCSTLLLQARNENNGNDKETSKYRNNIYGLGTDEEAVKILDVAIIVFTVAFVAWSTSQ